MRDFTFLAGTSNGSDSFWIVFLYNFFTFPNFGRIFGVLEYQWIKPCKSYNTVDTMQKQNMNWFETVLRVVICFIILTDLTEFSVEVLCGWSVRWSRRSRCEKKEERQELKLGDARGTPSKYSRRLKRLSLGMPRKASPLSSTSIGMFSDSFRSCDMCKSWSVFCI